jgi:hypothetical protein
MPASRMRSPLPYSRFTINCGSPQYRHDSADLLARQRHGQVNLPLRSAGPLGLLWTFCGVTLFAALLTPIAGLAAQLCRIGHGGITPVGILTPYAALLFLGGESDLLPLWIAILQFPVYGLCLVLSLTRGALGKTSVAIFVAHCITVVIVFARAH